MIKPINLGLSERQNLLLQRARLKLDYTQRARIDKSYDTNLQRRARSIVRRVQEQRKLRAAADNFPPPRLAADRRRLRPACRSLG